MINPKFCGVVLAGGKSSRMGKDKATLTLNGETLLQRAITLLESSGADQVLVSRNNAPDTLQDIFPFQGPLAGIHAALCATEQDLLIVPVDMPLLNDALLLTLLTGAAESGARHYQRFPIPAFIPNSAEARDFLEQVLSGESDRSVRRFLNHIGAKSMQPEQSELLVNVNTPEEWANLTDTP